MSKPIKHWVNYFYIQRKAEVDSNKACVEWLTIFDNQKPQKKMEQHLD